MKLLRETIRKMILQENASHENKLATLIGTLELENVRQALELGEAIGLIDDYTEGTHSMYNGDLIKWNVKLKRSLAEKIGVAILSNPNPSISYPFTSSANHELLHYDESELPEYTEIQFRILMPHSAAK
jgi:hypothetical protein